LLILATTNRLGIFVTLPLLRTFAILATFMVWADQGVTEHGTGSPQKVARGVPAPLTVLA